MAETGGRWGAGGYETVRAPAAVAVWHFEVERERAAVGRLNDALEQALPAHVPEAVLRALQVALDELLTNVIMHAQQATGAIEVAVSRMPDVLDTRISYCADAFDPTAWRAPVASTSVASARIGGLGIELVRLLMDEFRHDYNDGRNVIVLRKRC